MPKKVLCVSIEEDLLNRIEIGARATKRTKSNYVSFLLERSLKWGKKKGNENK